MASRGPRPTVQRQAVPLFPAQPAERGGGNPGRPRDPHRGRAVRQHPRGRSGGPGGHHLHDRPGSLGGKGIGAGRTAAAIPARFFIFVDDNLTADRDYARALFQSLAPLSKRWITQSSLEIADDEGFVRSAAEAGCVGVFVGLETFSEDNRSGVQKTCNRIQKYRDKIRMLHRHGIGVEAGVVFGFDRDDLSVFARALGQLDELEINMDQVSIFTPRPATRPHSCAFFEISS